MDTSAAPAIIEHASVDLPFTPAACAWLPRAPAFAALGATPRGGGALRLLELTTPRAGGGGGPPLQVAASYDTAAGLRCCSCGTGALVAGGADGALAVWDVRRLGLGGGGGGVVARPAPAPVFSVQAHAGMVNAIAGVGATSCVAPEVATGGRDGSARLWDPRAGWGGGGAPVAELSPAPGAAGRECWAVALGGSVGAERVLAAGYDNGDVVLFDLRARAVRWQANVGGAVTALDFDRADAALNKLVVATLEASFRVYDLRAPAGDGGNRSGGGFAHLAERAHKATVWLAKHTPHNRDLWATAGGNGGINLYKYHYPDRRAVRAGADGAAQAGVMGRVELLNARILAPQPIAGLDWHADRVGLACAVALDQTAKVLLVTKLDQY